MTLVAPEFGRGDPRALNACTQEMQTEVHAVHVRLHSPIHRAPEYLGHALRGEPAIDYYPEMAACLTELMKRERYDVIELEGSGLGIYLPVLLESPDSRFILVFYDIMWQWWKREFLAAPRLVSLARWATYRRWEPRLTQQVDACVFMSQVDADLTQSVTKPKRSAIVPNGIDWQSFELGRLPDNQEVLFVGSLSHPPNRQAAGWLINDIWPRIERRAPAAHLTIIGRDAPPHLVAQAHSMGVTLISNVPDVRPYYAHARAAVVPILGGGGIRVKILEAMASGRPVITTRLGAEGLPLIPGKHALFADEPEEIAEAVVRALKDRDLAEQLRAEGRALVEREFNWEELALKQESVFYGESRG